jgi:hypothetical protein
MIARNETAEEMSVLRLWRQGGRGDQIQSIIDHSRTTHPTHRRTRACAPRVWRSVMSTEAQQNVTNQLACADAILMVQGNSHRDRNGQQKNIKPLRPVSGLEKYTQREIRRTGTNIYIFHFLYKTRRFFAMGWGMREVGTRDIISITGAMVHYTP